MLSEFVQFVTVCEMEEFLGNKYVLVSSENFDEYLVFLGKGYLARKTAISLRPVHRLALNDDGTYTMSFNSTLVNSSITFALGREFDEVKPDGVKVKTTITIQGNKMIQVQRDKGTVLKHVYEYFTDKMNLVRYIQNRIRSETVEQFRKSQR